MSRVSGLSARKVCVPELEELARELEELANGGTRDSTDQLPEGLWATETQLHVCVRQLGREGSRATG